MHGRLRLRVGTLTGKCTCNVALRRHKHAIALSLGCLRVEQPIVQNFRTGENISPHENLCDASFSVSLGVMDVFLCTCLLSVCRTRHMIRAWSDQHDEPRRGTARCWRRRVGIDHRTHGVVTGIPGDGMALGAGRKSGLREDRKRSSGRRMRMRRKGITVLKAGARVVFLWTLAALVIPSVEEGKTNVSVSGCGLRAQKNDQWERSAHKQRFRCGQPGRPRRCPRRSRLRSMYPGHERPRATTWHQMRH